MLDIASKALINFLTGLPRVICSGTLGAEGLPSPWNSNWYGSTSNALENFSSVLSEGAVYPPFDPGDV